MREYTPLEIYMVKNENETNGTIKAAKKFNVSKDEAREAYFNLNGEDMINIKAMLNISEHGSPKNKMAKHIKKMVEDLTPMLAYEALTKKAIQSRLNQPMHRINYVLTKLQREGIVKGFRIKTSECGISEDNAPAWFYKYTLTDNADSNNY